MYLTIVRSLLSLLLLLLLLPLSRIQFSGYMFLTAPEPIVGVDYTEGTPVPIPNTEVKLSCADDT